MNPCIKRAPRFWKKNVRRNHREAGKTLSLRLDLHPDRYELHRNGTLVTSGPWDGSVIQFSVDSLLVGNYSFTITVWDVDGNMVSDEVIVIVSPEGSTSTTTMDSGYVTMVIAIGVGSTIIILIVIIFIGSKKRRRGG